MNSSRKECCEDWDSAPLVLQAELPAQHIVGPQSGGPQCWLPKWGKEGEARLAFHCFAPLGTVQGLTPALKRREALEHERHRGRGGRKAGVLSKLPPPIFSRDTWAELSRVLSPGTLKHESCSICIEEWAKSGRKCPDRGRQSIKIPPAIPWEGVYSS